MAKLVYSAITSLDGYIEDETGRFDWAQPDDEVFAFICDLERSAATHLYGRRMYEVMAPWETDPSFAEHSPLLADFARIWQGADKVVYSTTLESVKTARTTLERSFDAEAVREMKATKNGEILIAGPDLASSAFRAGLVDECHLFVVPWLIGGGKKGLPATRSPLRLLDQRSFPSGVVFMHYEVANEGESQ